MSEHSYSARKLLDATLSVNHNGAPFDQQWLRLGFATNPDGLRVSRFNVAIYPRHFAELARMMIEADPAAAIRAFGVALQDAKVERRKSAADDEVAA